MPERLEYSTVAMVTTFWPRAPRALGRLGVDPGFPTDRPSARSAVIPEARRLSLHGLAQRSHLDPELERHGWQGRTSVGRQVKII
jgi:5,6-dimethylbenzimidazole synthase